MIKVRVLLMVGCVSAWLVGQDPVSVDAKQRERAEQLLSRHAEHSKSVNVLVADYVQRRSTALSKKPLVSRGTFLFVKQPAAVVFRAQQPREAIIRLTTARYEVFRPKKKRLERFVLAGPELAQGLFAALGGDAARLLREFDVRSCLPAGEKGAMRVDLVPKGESVKKRLRELRITFGKEAKLQSVAYRDHSGDLVEIELTRLQLNPKQPPSVEFDVPKDTRVIEHRPKPAK